MDHKGLLLTSGALIEGHFVYASDRHGRYYVNKTAGLVPASHARLHAEAIASYFVDRGVEAVVAPELGAIPLMTRVADRLLVTTALEVAGIIATKVLDAKPQRFRIARDQARFIEGKRTVVIEDILTSGGSAAAAVSAAETAGAEVIGVGALWNRGGVTADMLDVPELFCCVDEQLADYEAGDCPFCREGVPINTDLGKGEAFLRAVSAVS